MNSNNIYLIVLILLFLSNSNIPLTTLFLLLGFLTANGNCNPLCSNSTTTTTT